MASEYFGLKGKLVKQYQDILNSLGANLKVGGKWGKKTEEAFNKYRDQFLEAIGVKTPEFVNPYQQIEYTTRTDEEREAAAQRTYGGKYDAELETLTRGTRDQQEALARQMEEIDPAHEAQQAQLGQQYQQQRQTLSDAALSRGLGRSSYVTDQLSGSQQREIADANVLAEGAAKRKQQLSDSITKLGGDLTQSTTRLTNEREQSILAAIEQYRKEDSDQQNAALQYNNQLTQQARTEQEQTRQFEKELQQALRLARLKKK